MTFEIHIATFFWHFVVLIKHLVLFTQENSSHKLQLTLASV